MWFDIATADCASSSCQTPDVKKLMIELGN